MQVLDLFSGIGGFSIAAEAMGWNVAAHCEFADYPTKVLKKRWPDVPHFHDVRDLTAVHLAEAGITRVDVITGGFPCQDVSMAGGRRGIGTDDDPTRSGLFREIVRLADELSPNMVVMENVQGILSQGLDYVAAVFADRGWTFEWCMIPASAVGAPHQRNRVWMVCHRDAPHVFGTGDAIGHRDGDGWGVGSGSLFGAAPLTVMPKCGYAHDGTLYEVPWTAAKKNHQQWPTPRVSSANGPTAKEITAGDPKKRLKCAVAVNWPTLIRNDAERRGDHHEGLRGAIVEWVPIGEEIDHAHDCATTYYEGDYSDVSTRQLLNQGLTREQWSVAHLTVQVAQNWPTPQAFDATEVVRKDPESVERQLRRGDPNGTLRTSTGNLREDVVLWSTPQAANADGGQRLPKGASDTGLMPNGRKYTVSLNQQVAWASPVASNYKGVGPLGSVSHDNRLKRSYLDAQAQDAEKKTGALNPDWEDTLMGLPIGWTDVDCDEPIPVPCFPMGRGQDQHDWEPPRLTTVKKNRADRVRGLGNAIVWQVAYHVFMLTQVNSR